MGKAYKSFGAMMKAKTTETEKALRQLPVDQWPALYDRWIAYFDYADLIGAEVDTFSTEWGPAELTAKMFEADPFDMLLQFLLSERLVAE